MQLVKGDLAGALLNYRAALTIRVNLAEQDPGNAVWQYGLAVSQQKLGLVYQQSGQTVDALVAFRKAAELIKPLTVKAPDHAGWQKALKFFLGPGLADVLASRIGSTVTL